MIQHEIMIQNKLGLHTRAAAKLVDTAKHYQSKVEVIFRDRAVDGKSIMGVITLGARKDDLLGLQISGDDEEEAYQALSKLINERFGEKE